MRDHRPDPMYNEEDIKCLLFLIAMI